MNCKKQRGHSSPLPRALFLSVFFLLGIVLGQLLSNRVPDETGQELTSYLQHYFILDDRVSPQAALSTFVLYFRYPLLAALLGFASIGVILLPCITVVFGLFLSFSVSCFTAAFGVKGVLLALAVFGLRCVVTLPCYFLLAVPALAASSNILLLSFGKGRRIAVSVTYGRAWWKRLGLCGLVLLAGVCVDLFVSPWLLSMALGHILT